MELPESRFDGVFANAALFHVPTQELPRVLGEISETLKSRGVLFRNLSTTLRHRRFLFTDSFLLLWKWRVG